MQATQDNKDANAPTPAEALGEQARLLGHAASERNIEEVRFILKAYPKVVHARGGIMRSTPLHRAASYGHVETARVLLEHGADPNKRSRGFWDVTALHVAAWRGHVEVARLLIEHNANPHLKDRYSSGTALDWATAHDNAAVVSLLKPLTTDK